MVAIFLTYRRSALQSSKDLTQGHLLSDILPSIDIIRLDAAVNGYQSRIQRIHETIEQNKGKWTLLSELNDLKGLHPGIFIDTKKFNAEELSQINTYISNKLSMPPLFKCTYQGQTYICKKDQLEEIIKDYESKEHWQARKRQLLVTVVTGVSAYITGAGIQAIHNHVEEDGIPNALFTNSTHLTGLFLGVSWVSEKLAPRLFSGPTQKPDIRKTPAVKTDEQFPDNPYRWEPDEDSPEFMDEVHELGLITNNGIHSDTQEIDLGFPIVFGTDNAAFDVLTGSGGRMVVLNSNATDKLFHKRAQGHAHTYMADASHQAETTFAPEHIGHQDVKVQIEAWIRDAEDAIQASNTEDDLDDRRGSQLEEVHDPTKNKILLLEGPYGTGKTDLLSTLMMEMIGKLKTTLNVTADQPVSPTNLAKVKKELQTAFPKLPFKITENGESRVEFLGFDAFEKTSASFYWHNMNRGGKARDLVFAALETYGLATLTWAQHNGIKACADLLGNSTEVCPGSGPFPPFVGDTSGSAASDSNAAFVSMAATVLIGGMLGAFAGLKHHQWTHADKDTKRIELIPPPNPEESFKSSPPENALDIDILLARSIYGVPVAHFENYHDIDPSLLKRFYNAAENMQKRTGKPVLIIGSRNHDERSGFQQAEVDELHTKLRNQFDLTQLEVPQFIADEGDASISKIQALADRIATKRKSKEKLSEELATTIYKFLQKQWETSSDESKPQQKSILFGRVFVAAYSSYLSTKESFPEVGKSILLEIFNREASQFNPGIAD